MCALLDFRDLQSRWAGAITGLDPSQFGVASRPDWTYGLLNTVSRGVDGIITNKVAMAKQVPDLRAKLTPLGRFVVWMAGEAGLLRGMEKSSAHDDA